MATLTVWTYINHFVERGVPPTAEDRRAASMVECLKGEPFSPFEVSTADRGALSFNVRNRAEFLALSADRAAAKLKSLISEAFTIVPVPNKAALSGDTSDFGTLKLARLVASKCDGRAIASPALRWTEALKKARSGGIRDRRVLAEKLQIVANPTGTIVLLDDVYTTGSHMSACARKLLLEGTMPAFGMALARATYEQPPKRVEWKEHQVLVRDDVPPAHF